MPNKPSVQAVYDLVRLIPRGRACSYSLIAQAIGFPNYSRQVGRIISQADSAETGIPAHRVVNSQGILSGRAAFGSSNEMQRLLEAEGIVIVNHRIKNWKQVRWNPMEEWDSQER